ncbi:MAG: hypothetical protein FWD69_15205 [Polyangiaceae bacterium]|nr:hypothetical protein [Polyangiaceae bacterium]
MPDRSTFFRSSTEGTSRYPRGSLLAALPVYVEAFVADARVLVLGGAELGVAVQLLELGASSVDVYDPDATHASDVAAYTESGIAYRPLDGAIDAEEGAFDVAIIPDLAALWGTGLSASVSEVRRLLTETGAVIAMGRAHTGDEESAHVLPDLHPAVLTYGELYELFARQFEYVTMTGVVPFSGIVFAELGDAEDLSVSVDARLGNEGGPEVFVVLASDVPKTLDPYSIVQVPGGIAEPLGNEDVEAASSVDAQTAYAAVQRRADDLARQVEELGDRLSMTDAARIEASSQAEQTSLERDAVILRARQELDEISSAARQAVVSMERRLAVAERGMLERDDQIAALGAEIDSLHAESERHEGSSVDAAEVHATETAILEAQLRDRARMIAEMERELVRREHLVKELVAEVEELRAGGSPSEVEADSSVLVSAVAEAESRAEAEIARYRNKLDELALDVARREGELRAQTWRITELENALAAAMAQAEAEAKEMDVGPTTPRPQGLEIERDLARANDELAALRQALVQEHAARVAVESGEELTRARTELQRQAVLLEQMRALQTPTE